MMFNKRLIKVVAVILVLVSTVTLLLNNDVFKANASETEVIEDVTDEEGEAENSSDVLLEDDENINDNECEFPIIDGGTMADEESNLYSNQVTRASQSQDIWINQKAGARLISNTWVGTRTKSGNTYQWEYQVSANVNTGHNTGYKVEEIKTTWVVGASLRNGASLNIGVSKGGIFEAGGSSEWQNVESDPKYWKNTNGQKESSYRTNFIIKPSRDYRSSTRYVTNTAFVRLYKKEKTYQISSGV